MIREQLGAPWAAEVEALEARFRERASQQRAPSPRDAPPARAPDRGAALDVDVLLAGGGLSLLYASALAARGLRVAVADPRGVGKGHREWNASLPELRALHEGGALDEADVAPLVVSRYQRGLVRWHGGAPLYVRGVLDTAVDAQGLLDLLRGRALARGAVLLDGVAVLGHRSGKGGVVASLRGPGGTSSTMSARLLLDGRGAASPHARWDLVCPTVGGVMSGLVQGDAPDEVDPQTGEILVSVEGTSGGTQPIWEGFPGRPGELTTYLFEYTEPRRLGAHPLRDLFHRFFATLPRYKRAAPGGARMLRPTFGFIPAYTRLRRMPTAPDDRVLLVGDAAARHSPLTFCGFGSALRSYGPVCARLAALLERDTLDRAALAPAFTEHGSLGVQGALALMMIDRGGLGTASDPQAVNRLLDAAFRALAVQGDEAFRDFLLDRAPPGSLWNMLRGVGRERPGVYGEALRNLSFSELAAFGFRFASFALRSRGRPPPAQAEAGARG